MKSILANLKCELYRRARLFHEIFFNESTDLGSLIKNAYIIWKLQDFSAPQILREINFGHFEAPKTAMHFEQL